MLAPSGVEVDAELFAALDRRDLAITKCEAELVAFAYLCRHAQQSITDTRQGHRGEGLILLLVQPLRLEDPAALVHAVERYAPHAAIWMFDPSSSPRLRAVKVDDVVAWSAAPPPPTRISADRPTLSLNCMPVVSRGESTPRSGNSSEPKPRLSGQENSGKQTESRYPAGNGENGQLLTTEELSMLLADDAEGAHN